MPKFAVYSTTTATVFLGEFEAPDKDAAIGKALEENPPHVSLCHQCSGEVELGDFLDEHAEELK